LIPQICDKQDACVTQIGSPDFMVISKTYCFGSRKKEHPKIVYLDTFYHKMSGEPYSDLAPSKKVTGGERQKAKGKRQND
jgi:hypothetical protein